MTNVLVQGASRGIGLGLARALLRRSEDSIIYASSRRPGQSRALEVLGEEFGQRLRLVDMDVTDASAVDSAARRVADEVGRLHMVFNVSGLLHDAKHGPEKKLGHLDADWMRRSFDVHAVGPALVAKHFVPLLRHDERAVFANMSARVGSIGDNRKGGWYSYRISKAAQNMLTKTLAIELAMKAPNVLCVALHPGTVDTALSKPFQKYVGHRVFDADRAATQLLDVVDALTPEQSGGFFAWDGSTVPW